MRWFHAAVYLVVLPLLLTGWRLLGGDEGRPSPLARIAGMSDARLHVWLGRAFALLILVPIVTGRKGIATFMRESLRRDPGDRRWWARWPSGALRGRFARHEGDFDPGQRIANLVIVGGLIVLTLTGIGLTVLHGGPTFSWLARIHRWTFYVVTVAIIGHVAVALGVLPGYRRVACDAPRRTHGPGDGASALARMGGEVGPP